MRIKKQPRKGQALLEYALLMAGVALVSLVAVSILGRKIGGMIAATAVVLPGANAADNGPIVVGHLVETTTDGNGHITLDTLLIRNRSGMERLGVNVLGEPTNPNQRNPFTLASLIVESE